MEFQGKRPSGYPISFFFSTFMINFLMWGVEVKGPLETLFLFPFVSNFRFMYSMMGKKIEVYYSFFICFQFFYVQIKIWPGILFSSFFLSV